MRAARGHPSPGTLLAALLVSAYLSTAAAHVHFFGQPEVTAAADRYATMTFVLDGEGRFRFEIVPPAGWTVVTRGGVLDLHGDGFVSATVRVPTFAPAGERFATELRLLDDERLVATTYGHVTVARSVELSLQGPGDLVGVPGVPLAFEVVVGNEGNARDTVLLSARHSHWDVRFDGPEVDLEPGERRVVRVTLRPTTTVNSGYRHIFYLVASSQADPAVEVVTEVTSRFFAAGHAGDPSGTERPQLTLSVGAGVTAGLTAAAGDVATRASYWVRPGLEGQLSDFVDGSVHTNRLAGDLTDPFAEVPSSLSLALEGPDWDGSLDVGPQRYAVGIGVDLEDWRVSAAGSVAPGSAVGAEVRLESRDRALQVLARTGSRSERRTDALVVSYGTDLTEDLALSLSGGVSGFAGGDSGAYQAALSVSERLEWQNDRFDVSQSYAGVPFAGVHTVGLSGGTRRLSPFGVRAQTAYTRSPVSDRWSSAVTLYGNPAPGLTADVTAGLVFEGAGAREGVTWSVSPRLAYGIRSSAGLAANLVVRYGHGGVLVGAEASWDRYEAGLGLGYGDLRLSAGAAYEVRRGGGATSPDTSLKVTVRPEVALGSRAVVFADYRYEQWTSPVARAGHEIGLGWIHTWGPQVASRLEYQRAFDLIGDADHERLGLSLAVRDVVTPGLQLDAGYVVTSPTSLLDFATPPTHDVRVGVGYAVPLTFDTPEALIELFGGRRGADVQGVAFLDENRSGTRDPSDRPLAGLEIRIGSERTTTDAEGNYRLRVPAGTHELSFPTGLPATVDLRGERTIQVVENERLELLLPFAPVVSVAVELFDDRDRDGVRDVGEEGIAFGGVVFDGPDRKVVRTDAAGRATVSGLVTGTYAVSASAAHLPDGYRATSEPIRVTLSTGARAAAMQLGAARPPRTVVRTFSAGTLAVLPRALQTSAAPGSEIDLEALVQGSPERVVVAYGTQEASFEPAGGGWRARIRIPREAPIGLLELTVRAENREGSVERPLFVTVVDRPPFSASSVVAAVGEHVVVEITTQFWAQEVRLVMPGGEPMQLASDDGYRWTATWRAPGEAGRFLAAVVVDGEALGEVAISVVAPHAARTGLDEEASAALPAAARKGRH